MTQTSEHSESAAELFDREQTASRLARQIAEAIEGHSADPTCAITELLADELLNLKFTDDDRQSLNLFLSTGDESLLIPMAAKAIEHILPTDIDHYPFSKQRMVDNFNASGLRPLIHYANSLLEELHACGEQTTGAIEKIIKLELSCTDLLSDKSINEDLATITHEEVARNQDELLALGRIAEREGITLDPAHLMQIQPAIYEMLTSNDPVTTADVNYRKRLNSMPGAARSLQAPEAPNPDKLLSRYGNYINFIEATAATKRGGYASTFGFLHKVALDETGNPFIVEYPHTMFDEEILNINHPVVDSLKNFEQDFHRTHDMLHNALPVYADHFMIHHPSAPITLGGYLPDYVAFGKGMRKDKSSYELGLAILHRQIMQERFTEDPTLLETHVTTVHTILDGLTDMQINNLCSDRAIDHISFVVMSAAMNILPFDSSAYQELLDHYDQLDLPSVTVHPSDVYKLLLQQEVVTANEALYANIATRTSKDQTISQLCKQVNDHIAVTELRSANIDYTHSEQGAECIVAALKQMGINPIGMNEPITFEGRDRLRWIGITASSRRLKGFNEKIHGLQTVRFWNEESKNFEDLAPVALLGKFYDHFQKHTDEYDRRIWFRGLSNATLHHFKKLTFSPSQGLKETALQSSPEALSIIDRCICALIDDNYEPLTDTDQKQLMELASYLATNGDHGSATQLQDCLRAYSTLVQEAADITARNGHTFIEARKNLTERLMSLDG